MGPDNDDGKRAAVLSGESRPIVEKRRRMSARCEAVAARTFVHLRNLRALGSDIQSAGRRSALPR